MRELHQYSLKEWILLAPVKHGFKEARNDFVLRRYVEKKAAGEEAFLEACRGLAARNLMASIAFEQPLAIDWMLSLARRNRSEFQILIFDNSRNPARRDEIKQVCQRHKTPYLALPPNPTRHANRSHGMALTWVYRRIIRQLNPQYFGFIDHDMLPVAPTAIIPHLQHQSCYGMINPSGRAWHLWAGFCFFDFAKVAELPLNFLYDFSRELDTGGRNWNCLYSKLDKSRLEFAPVDYVKLRPANNEMRTVQLIDKHWIHMVGIGYDNNFEAKRTFFTQLFAYLETGRALADILISSTPHSPDRPFVSAKLA